MRYHIYWNDKVLFKDLDEEEFENIWSKLHWVYNKELNYICITDEVIYDFEDYLEEVSY
tara:strand:+ start:321 stop:497 length:177 start_codon:yes stop_codon:yes gene_type:complete